MTQMAKVGGMGWTVRRADLGRHRALMIFSRTEIPGVWIIDLERRQDERGYFARTFCQAEFAQNGLPTIFPQINISYNARRGTLRGMHFQMTPQPEGKPLCCIGGAIYDVVVDLRRDQPTFCHWIGIDLNAENGRALYVPEGLAHGFMTLMNESVVHYQMTESYNPNLARGVRWNDPTFAIRWPLPKPNLSVRDASYPDFVP